MIRTVAEADSQAIADIYNTYILESTATFETEALTDDEMRARISRLAAAGPYLVYEVDGCVVGYAYAHEWKERAAFRGCFETTVDVARGYEGRGIGSALMLQLIDACRDLGARQLIACITAENTQSRRMHERLGFTQVSLFRNVGLKFGRLLDVSDYQLGISNE